MNRPGVLKVLALVAMMCLCSTSGGAQSRGEVKWNDSRFTVAPYAEVVLGSTEYTLLASGVKSRLEFPLNMLVLGLSSEYALRGGEMDEWRFQLLAGTAVSGPWGVLKDHDWYLVEGVPRKLPSTGTEPAGCGSIMRPSLPPRVDAGPPKALYSNHDR